MTDNVDSFQRFTDREQVSPAFPYPETLAVRRRLAPWILSRIREINRHGLGNLCAPGVVSIDPELTTTLRRFTAKESQSFLRAPQSTVTTLSGRLRHTFVSAFLE